VRKPENTFISGVHKYLPNDVPYHEKMANPYRGGTPDVYYSGSKKDLWIEYKYIEKLPVKVPIKVDLSALQVIWLSGRHAEGRNVAVVVGSKDGCLLLRYPEWERTDITSAEFKERCMTRKELGAWILRETVKE
jgi:hypothetical protein